METGTKAVLPNIRKKLGQLRKLGNQIPFKSRKFIAEGILMGKLQYLITQWGGANQTILTSAQRTQNCIARWVTGGSRRTKVKKMLTECGWMSIYQSVLQFWKICNIGKPETIAEKIRFNENLEAQTENPRLQFTTEGYRWRTVNNWNRIPSEMRLVKSLPVFKKRLRHWIISGRNWDPD